MLKLILNYPYIYSGMLYVKNLGQTFLILLKRNGIF